uniref:ribonuclease H n=2 Tax=Parascaris univalens TaxID=6257 RepID=A0A914ZYU2_PARUN
SYSAMLRAAGLFFQRHARFLTHFFPAESTESLITACGISSNQTVSGCQSGRASTTSATDGALSPLGKAIIVYTDGSCVDGRASGIGIFFGKDHPLNISKAIEGREHNSCLAEIIAAQTALKTLRNWKLYRNEAVILRTDFLPLVSAMRSSGYCGRFHDDYAILKEEAKRFPKGVEFEHVFGHEGEPGNEAANELARLATAPARATRSYSVPPSCRFRTQDTSRRRSQRRSRSRSTNGRPRSRVRSRNIHNNVDRTGKSRHHCRSSSAFVPGHKSRK